MVLMAVQCYVFSQDASKQCSVEYMHGPAIVLQSILI